MVRVRGLSDSKKHNFLQAVFFILLACLAMYVFLQSPVFEVHEIKIFVNNDQLNLQQVSAQSYIALSGVILGNNIFKLNLNSGEEEISLLPMVKEVKITRRFPATVIIAVVERKPVALLPTNKGFIELDKEGIYLRKGQFSEIYLPVITGSGILEDNKKINSSFLDLQPGQKMSGKSITVALQVIDELPPALLNNLSEIHIDVQNRITIYTIDGIQGRFGLPEELYQKGDIFLQVLQQVHHGQEIKYIDINSFKAPVVKYMETSGQ
ncbi:MAG: cell division protein FtsQ/DivIB [Desulfotomaculum sp.]|nr:cell division protein FtsQ/DivIB [Desulfotomaculum sp.]MCL0080729.1 cell division protein FtsQ/DivIB [Peptococcaceae bacterium]